MCAFNFFSLFDVSTSNITYVCEFGRNFFNPIINSGLLFPSGVLYGVRFIFNAARDLDNEGFQFSVWCLRYLL